MASRIERRLLLTYRVDPEVARDLVPAGLDLDVIGGAAVAGVCLIRLSRTRPAGLPAVGWGAENAAHRIAVRWRDGGDWVRGVYIPVRHTASRLGTAAGGRVFPGTHRRARLDVDDDGHRVAIAVRSADVDLAVDAVAGEPWRSSVFADPAEASRFYRGGGIGLSPRRDGSLEAVRLEAETWTTTPMALRSARSSFYDALPPGSAEPDSALLMRDLDVVWRRADPPRTGAVPATVG